jgi:hypothetical protein
MSAAAAGEGGWRELRIHGASEFMVHPAFLLPDWQQEGQVRDA